MVERYKPAYKITFEENEMQKEFLVLGVREKYVYKNGQKTSEIDGFSVSLLSDDYRELIVNVNVPSRELVGVDGGQKVKVEYDQLKSKLYVKDGFICESLWAKLYPVEASESGWA